MTHAQELERLVRTDAWLTRVLEVTRRKAR